MRVLITGGAGFIGSHLAERLLEKGDEVFASDNLWTGKLANLSRVQNNKGFHLVVDTILNESVMNELVFKADHIYHLETFAQPTQECQIRFGRLNRQVFGNALELRSWKIT
jgi:UDP-glucose 4-epimerase